ncbi:uncharacterized protein LOC119367694 [Triticum dicoccoides]|uniref:uncharacterized protein LOC119367694 n=1 Tax=Triticum dicoccoides TaxID=85692 RepID=UPI00189034EA|nr:uncharacterized protein LOC119367694 [Triticum dicoccoides]
MCVAFLSSTSAGDHWPPLARWIRPSSPWGWVCMRLADSPENTTTSRKEGLHPQPHAILLMRPCNADSLLLPPPHVQAPPLPSQGSMSAGRHAPLSSDLSLPTSLCSTPGEVPGARRMKYRQRHRAVLYISPCNFVSCNFGYVRTCSTVPVRRSLFSPKVDDHQGEKEKREES